MQKYIVKIIMNNFIIFIKSIYNKYQKLVPIVVFVSIFMLSFYVYTQSDFYFFIQYQILKQQEKIIGSKNDIKYYDMVSYNAFCNKNTFEIYMHMQPLQNQLMIDKVCYELKIRYNKLLPIYSLGNK